MTRIRAVLLDADGVVQLPAENWLSHLKAFAPRDPQAFLSDVFDAERPCLSGDGDFYQVLSDVLSRWQINASVDDLLKVWTLIEPQPFMLDVVNTLRERSVTVALATNQQSHRARHMREALGYGELFDALLISSEIGCMKPEQAFFKAALQRLGQDPEHALFIDDHPDNIEAARLCGLHAECYHVDHGRDELMNILRRYHLPV